MRRSRWRRSPQRKSGSRVRPGAPSHLGLLPVEQAIISTSRSRLRHISNAKTLFPRDGTDAIVERHQLKRSGPSLCRHECCRQLEGVGRTQRVHTKKSSRHFSNRIAGIDLVPLRCQFSQLPQCKRNCRRVNSILTFEASQSRNTLHFGTPPDQHGGVFRNQRLHAPRRSAAARSRKRPRISPPRPPLFDQGADGGCPGL